MIVPRQPSTDVNEVEFLLWTPENPSSEQILVLDDAPSVESSSFNANRPTKILVHGYTDNGRSHWIKDMRDEFFKFGKYM